MENPRPSTEAEASDPKPTTKRGVRSTSGRRCPVLLAAMLAGVAVGVSGLAVAATAAGPAGWRRGPPLELVQRFTLRELDSVGATAAQEAKVHDIIAAAFSDLGQNPGQFAASRRQALDLLRAPVVDRAAAEKLRADRIAAFDATSRKMVGAVLDAAEQLTPEQRAQLADRAEAAAQRGPWGGRHDGFMGRYGRTPTDGGPGRDFGPGRGPDGN